MYHKCTIKITHQRNDNIGIFDIVKIILLNKGGILWWLYHVASKNINKLKMFKIFLQLHRFVAYIV